MRSVRAIITFLEGPAPDQGLPGGGFPVFPDNSLPPGVDNSLPGLPPGAVQLPVFPFDPTRPDNSLPEVPVVWPPRPGQKFIVKYLACKGLILVPDNSLPSGGARPDQGLPPTTPQPK